MSSAKIQASWHKARPEIERDLDPGNPGDWWYMMRLAGLRSILTSTMRVLDLGCGPGWPAIRLSPHVREVVAVDASDLAIALITRFVDARRTTNVRVERANATDLPFPDNTFDAITAVDLMDVVSSPFRVAQEMFRVLKPGGRAVSCVQNFRRVLGGPLSQ